MPGLRLGKERGHTKRQRDYWYEITISIVMSRTLYSHSALYVHNCGMSIKSFFHFWYQIIFIWFLSVIMFHITIWPTPFYVTKEASIFNTKVIYKNGYQDITRHFRERPSCCTAGVLIVVQQHENTTFQSSFKARPLQAPHTQKPCPWPAQPVKALLLLSCAASKTP